MIIQGNGKIQRYALLTSMAKSNVENPSTLLCKNNKLLHCYLFSKRRQFNTLELRDEANKNYNAKQNTLLNMKNEPINKKLMELAEGRLNTRLSREKSVDAPPNKIIVIAREKSENKEPPKPVETKRVVHEENAPVVHPESDFSDISDDGDDILNMDDEVSCLILLLFFYVYLFMETNCFQEIECSKSTADSKKSVEREVQSLQNQEPGQPSPKLPVEESIFSKEKDSNSISFKLVCFSENKSTNF